MRKPFKQFILSTVLILPSLYGMPEEVNETLIPKKSLIEKAQQLTPGQKIIQKQHDLFDIQNLRTIFDEEEIESLEDQLRILSDLNLPFDDPGKRNALRQIKKFLKKYKDVSSKAYRLYLSSLELEEEEKDVHINRIEEITKEYLRNNLGANKVEFYPKPGNGVQLGTKAVTSNFEGEQVTYYIKTHSKGLISEKSTGAKPLEPQELLVYKLIEYFQIGCPAYLYGRDIANFYIATQDAGAEGEFKEYAKFIKDNPQLKTFYDLARKFDDYVDEEKEQEAAETAKQIEAEINHNLYVRDFVSAVSAMDLISRLLVLTDLHNNSDNFGLVKTNQGLKLKIIDFRVRDTKQFRVDHHDFGGLKIGNGVFQYTDSDPIMKYILRGREEELRMVAAKSIFNHIFTAYFENINRAKEHVEGILESLPTEGNLNKIIKELDSYTGAIQHNFKVFNKCFQAYPKKHNFLADPDF